MSRITVTQAVLDAMAADAAWVSWAEQGWVLRAIPIPGGRVAAFHDDRKMATDGAKRVTTLVRRITTGEISHYWFTNWRAGGKQP